MPFCIIAGFPVINLLRTKVVNSTSITVLSNQVIDYSQSGYRVLVSMLSLRFRSCMELLVMNANS